MLLMYNLLLVTALITFQLNIFAFKRHDFIAFFIAKKMCLLSFNKLSSCSYFQISTKIFYTARELVFAVLDRSIYCLCGKIKN